MMDYDGLFLSQKSQFVLRDYSPRVNNARYTFIIKLINGAHKKLVINRPSVFSKIGSKTNLIICITHFRGKIHVLMYCSRGSQSFLFLSIALN